MARPGNSRISTVYLLAAGLVGLAMWFMIAPEFRDEDRVARALRLSAQLAFLTYAAVFVARPLRQLLPNRTTQLLLANRPYMGVSLAAIMSVHLALITWWFVFVIRKSPDLLTLIVGGIAYLLILLMLITTYAAPARALGARNWRRLHRTGLYYIGAVYFNALIRDVFAKPADPVYLAIGIVMLVAITVRLAAFIKTRNQRTAAIASER